MFYELEKMSSPGYTITTKHLRIILEHLEQDICNSCLEELVLNGQAKYLDLAQVSREEKVGNLLNTPCGAEFSFNEFNHYDNWRSSL